MFQMMQLPGESLVQYEELEILLSSGIFTNLAENLWPLVPLEVSGSASSKGRTRPSLAGRPSGEAAEGEALPPDTNEEVAVTAAASSAPPLWMSACQQGEAVLHYSINNSRMKVLKNKSSMLELYHYVFARECFFLFGLNRLSLCAEKSLVFIHSVLTQWDAANPAAAPPLKDLMSLWAVVAAVHVARGCRQSALSSVTKAASAAAALASHHGNGESPMHSPAGDRKRGAPALSSSASGLDSAAMVRAIDDTLALRIRDSSKHLSDLLMYAKKKLVHLMSRQESAYSHFRTTAVAVTNAFHGWGHYAELTESFPAIFRCDESDAVGLDQDQEGAAQLGGNEVVKTPERSCRQRLFTDGIDNLEDVSVFPHFRPAGYTDSYFVLL